LDDQKEKIAGKSNPIKTRGMQGKRADKKREDDENGTKEADGVRGGAEEKSRHKEEIHRKRLEKF